MSTKGNTSKKDKEKKTVVKIVEKRTTHLHTAAANCEPQRLKTLIESGANVNVEDKDGAMPLHHAAYNGHMKIVKILLNNGAKINAKDNEGATALHNACFNGHVKIVEYLLTKGANIDELDEQCGSPLLNASYNGHAPVVDLLIKKGAKINSPDSSGTTALHYAAYNGHEEVLKLLLAAGCKVELIDNEGGTPLHHAATNGKIKCMRLLLKFKANINVTDHHGTTPLHSAAYNSHKECVKEILEFAKNHIAGIDLRPVLLTLRDHDGSTPLHKIAFQGDVDILQLLLDAKPDINALDKEKATALHKAAYKGNTACLRLLIERGARMDITDNAGGTALYNACYNGYVKCVEILLEKGNPADVQAMINLADSQGRGPLHAAACYGHWECTALLLKNKAALNLKDKDDMTPLHLAAFNGSQLSMAFLLDAGADCSLPNKDGVIALHYAAYNGWLSTVHHLIEKKSPINALDNKGASPLHYASACNHSDIVAYLVYKGAEIDIPNKEGMTPLAYATKNHAVDCVVTLLERSADPDFKDKKANTPRKLSKSKNNPTKNIFDTIGKRPFSAEVLARLSDFRDKRKKKSRPEATGGGGGFDINMPEFSISSPFTKYNIPFDLNDPGECIMHVYNDAKSIEQHWTVLNLCRLLLLIPNDPVNGRKMWNLLEMFANQLVMNEASETTKLTFKEFLNAWNNRGQTNMKKKEMLAAIENAFPIMFPKMPKKDENSSTWYSVDDDSKLPKDTEDGPDEDGPLKEEEEEEEEDEGGKKITPSGIKSKGAKGPIKLKDEEVEEEEGDQNKSSASLVSKGPAFKSSNKDLGPEEVLSGGWGMAPAAPPPPPGGAGGPPPPPPPPGGKGPPPPPPPGGKMKAKVVIKPKMKLRKLDWKKIPKTQLNTTIWKMLAVEGVELDEPSMIEYFKIPDDDSEQPKKKADNKGPIIALDMKKSNHVGLMLSMIKMTHNEIRQAILNVEDTKFTEDTLRAFIKLAPTKEDIESLKPFLTAPPETLARLGNSEKLFLAIMDIERLKEKLVSFLFKRTFTSASARLKDDIELAHLAVTELTKNVKFAKLLELILNIGNWLNYGTYAGDCFGFTLESLDKMRGTKSPTHPEISLLHYLVWFVAEKRPRLLDFTEELQYIDKGSQDHITAIQSEFSEMTQGFSAMTGELQTLAANPPAGGPDPFTLKMNEFAIKAKGEMENLTHLLDELNKANALLFSTYAADKGTCLITVVQAFCQQFVACRLENEQRQEQQEKPKKKRKKIKKKNTSTSSKTKGLMNTPKLGENGEEIRADDDDNDDNADDENALMKKLFPGKEGEEDDTAPKGDDDDEVPKAKKVKKIKKKVKKKKVKKADDDDDAGKDDDAE